MSTRIDFDFEEEEEEQTDKSIAARSGSGGSSTTFIDAFIPAYGWIPVERVAHDTVRVVEDDAIHVNCRTAPLFSRSLRDEFDSVRAGQGVLIEYEEHDPATLVSPIRGIVESIDSDGIYVRLRDGETLQVSKRQIRPFSAMPIPCAIERQGPRSEVERQYSESLKLQGLGIVPMRGDGNCLFRAVAHQIYGTPDSHSLIRRVCAEYMLIEQNYFEPFVAEASGRMSGRAPYTGFDQYIQALKHDGTWGDDPELQALCEIYQRPAEVYFWDARTRSAQILRRLNEESDQQGRAAAPIRLSFIGGGHYDSIIRLSSSSLSASLASSGAPRPGRFEGRALEMARARHAGGEFLATKLSDEMETERTQLEEALTKSRMHSEESRATGGGFNLQEALEQSLKSVSEDEKHNIEKARMQSLREVEEAELKRALHESMSTAAPQQYFAVPDELDDEEAMLRLAIEESLRGS